MSKTSLESIFNEIGTVRDKMGAGRLTKVLQKGMQASPLGNGKA
jgi:hypothetical protein